MAQKLMPRLDFPAGHRGGPSPPITQHDPVTLTRRLLEDREIPARERVAALLVAVYAQPIVRVRALHDRSDHDQRHRDHDPARGDPHRAPRTDHDSGASLA